MKHWAKFLPDAGKLVDYTVERSENINRNILYHQQEIEKYKKELAREERDIEKSLLDDWTPEEIAMAKQKALDYMSTHKIYE